MDNVVDIQLHLELKQALDQNAKLVQALFLAKRQLESANYANTLLITENEALKKYNSIFLEQFKCPK